MVETPLHDNGESQAPRPEPLPPEYFGLGALFTRLRDAVIVANTLTQRILLWNPAAETIFGYTRDEALGRRISETIIPTEYREQHIRGMAHYAATAHAPIMDNNRVLELPALTKSGTYLTVELTLTRLGEPPEEGGPHPYIMAVLRDVTERNRLETLARSLYGSLNTPRSRSPLNNVHPAHKPPNPSAAPLAPSTAHTLTPRETQVLTLLAQGHTNPQIATRLHLSVPTIKHHVKNLNAKLGCHSRAQAAVTAVKLGLLETN